MSAAITCASLALADAGIELYDLVASCTAGVLTTNTATANTIASTAGSGSGSGGSAASAGSGSGSGVCILDPSRAEQSSASYAANVTCAFMPSLQQITHFAQSGQSDDKTMTQVCVVLIIPAPFAIVLIDSD